MKVKRPVEKPSPDDLRKELDYLYRRKEVISHLIRSLENYNRVSWTGVESEKKQPA